MTAEQINKLPKAIAFTWCVGHGNGAQKWLAQYHKLIKYNKLNKDMNVNVRSGTLGNWAYTQQQQYRLFSDQKKSNIMTAE